MSIRRGYITVTHKLDRARPHKAQRENERAMMCRTAQGMSAFGRDPQGHEAKPASPVPKGNAP